MVGREREREVCILRSGSSGDGSMGQSGSKKLIRRDCVVRRSRYTKGAARCLDVTFDRAL